MTDKKNKNYKKYRKQTQMVRGGLWRSQHGETSEAIFMNSGYIFDSAEEAKARFAGESEGYLYSRYGNPTKQCLKREWLSTMRLKPVLPPQAAWRLFLLP